MGRMRFIIYILSVLSFASCVRVKGLYSGYNHLSLREKEMIVDYNGSIDSLAANDSVYRISVGQLAEYVRAHDKVIVYDYLPYCSGKDCVSPLLLEQYCKANNYELCVVASVYDDLLGLSGLSVPVLAINNDSFGTNLQARYTHRFYDELTGVNSSERGDKRYLYFNKGRFVKAFENIEEMFGKVSAGGLDRDKEAPGRDK